MLTDTQLRRYARNISLAQIGRVGQEKLRSARVLVVGAGGLGSAAISYLAAAGIGRIGVADFDRVELSNLQRQILHETSDVGRLKAQSARDRVEELNPDVKVDMLIERLDAGNAPQMVADYDIVADGSDNFATRFAVSDACHHAQKPLVSAAIRAWDGQLATFKSYLGVPQPCYRCFVEGKPEDERGCSDVGVIGALAGIMGSWQAMEIIKEILGIDESLAGELLLFNGLKNTLRKVRIMRNPSCICCAAKPKPVARALKKV
jgi:molybdopterin-synthase adenylyltransferase